MHHCDFGTMLLNYRFILSIACVLLFFKINLHLSVCFVVLMIIIFYVLLGVFVFLSCIHTILTNWISVLHYVFLGYSPSHLGYRYLDLASHRIYVSRHVHFHENVFSFANSEQITHTPVPSTQPTHLPPLHPSQFFQPTTVPTSPNNTPVLPSTAP